MIKNIPNIAYNKEPLTERNPINPSGCRLLTASHFTGSHAYNMQQYAMHAYTVATSKGSATHYSLSGSPLSDIIYPRE